MPQPGLQKYSLVVDGIFSQYPVVSPVPFLLFNPMNCTPTWEGLRRNGSFLWIIRHQVVVTSCGLLFPWSSSAPSCTPSYLISQQSCEVGRAGMVLILQFEIIIHSVSMKMLLYQPTHICSYYYIDHGTLNPSEFQPCTQGLRDKPGNSPFRKADFSLSIWLYCPSPKLMASCFLSFFFPQVTVLKLTIFSGVRSL